MTVEKIKELLSNKLTALNNQLNTANISGNIEAVMILEGEIEETTATLAQLNSI